MSLTLEKRVHFLKNVSGLGKKGLFSGIFTGKWLFSTALSQRFKKKGVFFSYVNISKRGDFLI